jgi:hypothetical protein
MVAYFGDCFHEPENKSDWAMLHRLVGQIAAE